ncbi:MAG: cobalt-precorrin-7 (C(5))-methyltransferase [Methanomicrobiales archaeon]|nr:cobalt-precorrin-7 (C(5))-methyltransferase [Methanomicrobiales archaeon]
MITEEAAAVLGEAQEVYGSRRALDLARRHLNAHCTAREIRDYRRLDHLPPDAIILSTGDPMLSGLGYLEGEVIPGISSLQVAAARLHLSLSRVSVVDAHGRDRAEALQDLMVDLHRGKWIFLLADPNLQPDAIAHTLSAEGTKGEIILCTNLGYPDELIVRGSIESPPAVQSRLFSVVIIPSE